MAKSATTKINGDYSSEKGVRACVCVQCVCTVCVCLLGRRKKKPSNLREKGRIRKEEKEKDMKEKTVCMCAVSRVDVRMSE